MALDIDEVKEYMHAEGEEDAVIASYLAMAQDYLAGAGVTEELATAEGYALCAKALTLHYYDNRGGAPIPEGLADYILQEQKRCRKAALAAQAAAVSESDTGSETAEEGEGE